MSAYKSAMRDYNFYKKRYETVVPIRGRSEDVRPIADRKRTQELVTKKVHYSGEVSYCATLYQTDVVEYHNNGNITLRTNGWQTPSTAEFMHMHSPFTVFKQENMLWARVPTEQGLKMFPIGDALEFRKSDDDIYEPVNKVLIKKRVVDREKAKAARAPLQPFLLWCKAFLTMSDGWIMHETRKEVIEFSQRDGGYMMFQVPREFNVRINHDHTALYEAICEADPDDYLKLLCYLLPSRYMCSQDRVVGNIKYQTAGGEWSVNVFDCRYDYGTLHKVAYKLAERSGNIYRVIEVEPGDKVVVGAM